MSSADTADAWLDQIYRSVAFQNLSPLLASHFTHINLPSNSSSFTSTLFPVGKNPGYGLNHCPNKTFQKSVKCFFVPLTYILYLLDSCAISVRLVLESFNNTSFIRGFSLYIVYRRDLHPSTFIYSIVSGFLKGLLKKHSDAGSLEVITADVIIYYKQMVNIIEICIGT